MSILDKIVTYKKQEVATAKANAPLEALTQLAKEAGATRPFKGKLEEKAASGEFALIAEIKKASPSKGLIRKDFRPEDHARAYEAAGAACLSILTDTPSFQGEGKYLRVARAATSLPCLRKDFMIDPYQCVQARAWGADCILLIMACLSDGQADELEKSAMELGMDVLIEVHNEEELTRALNLNSMLIGINNRDLNNFTTNLETTAQLVRQCPVDRFIISESGIATIEDLKKLRLYGASAFLVGESLMRQDNVEEATRALLGTNTRTA